jgi:ADP-heptose:LPS heptosyltransferase
VEKILVIQTAFIGDVILSTAVGKKLSVYYPEAKIDYVVRKGNEVLISNLPFINHVWIWEKKNQKTKNLIKLIRQIRNEKYDLVVNLQRFFSSGLMTAFSKGEYKVGYNKNPLSFAFTKSFEHVIGFGKHEVERNQELIASFTDDKYELPTLKLPEALTSIADKFINEPFICIAPASVWYTKQFPKAKWVEFIHKVPMDVKTIVLGAPNDSKIAEEIKNECPNHEIIDLCGKVSLIESAAIMKKAVMNYVNDSAPLHLASAVDGRVRAIFCSTVPEFGFGPLSSDSKIIQVDGDLDCRPCGLHGKKACPLGTFDCALQINTSKMAEELIEYLK